MKKEEAIQKARKLATPVKKIGKKSYQFKFYDRFCQKWKDAIVCGSFQDAQADRSQVLISYACEFLKIQAPIFEGGYWTQYIVKHEEFSK